MPTFLPLMLPGFTKEQDMNKSSITLIVSIISYLFCKTGIFFSFASFENKRVFFIMHVMQSRNHPIALQYYICSLNASLLTIPILKSQMQWSHQKNMPTKNAESVFSISIYKGYVLFPSAMIFKFVRIVLTQTIEGPNLNTFLVIAAAVISASALNFFFEITSL